MKQQTHPLPLSAEHPAMVALKVRIADINYGNHLGHDRLISLLHQARIEALAGIGASELDFFGTALILVRLEAEYCAQAFLHDHLDIAVWFGQLQRSRFVMHYRVERDNTLIAKAQTVMACFNYHTQRTTALPREFMEKYCDE